MSRGLVALVLVVGMTQRAAAQPAGPPSYLQAGKQATALLFAEDRGGIASAVSVGRAGYFVTAFHAAQRTGEKVRLVLRPGEEDQQVLQARVVRASAAHDLALLRAEGDLEVKPLPLGSEEGLFETAQVAVFGYPHGTRRPDFPEVTVNLARVTSLRKSQGKLHFVQFDTELNPGNSGGPVLDAEGRLVGIVWAKLGGGNINQAIPVGRVERFLTEPDVAISTPTVPFAARHEPAEFVVRVADFAGDGQGFDVSVEWTTPEGEQKRTALKPTEPGTYAATIVPVPLAPGELPLAVTAEFAAGLVRCGISDTEISLDGEKLRLSTIREISRIDGRVEVETVAGERRTVKSLEGLPNRGQFGDFETDVDFGRARLLKLRETGTGEAIACTVTVERDGKVVARSERKLLIAPSQGEEVAGDFVEFTKQAGWPAFFEANDAAVYAQDGLQIPVGRIVRTVSPRFFEEDFTLELEVQLDKEDNIALVGLGEATVDRGGRPSNCVYLRMHSVDPNHGEGRVVLSKHQFGDGIEAGRLLKNGKHLVRIQKRGRIVTFHVDADSDGESPDDITTTVPDLGTFAPFLHGKNTHLFIGTEGHANRQPVTFTRVRLSQESTPPK